MKNHTQNACSPMEWKQFTNLLKYSKVDITELKANKQKRLAEVRLITAMGCYTGLRASDLLQLKYKDVLNKESFIVSEQKTDKARNININQTLQDIIKFTFELLKCNANDFLISNEQRFQERPVSVQNLNKKLKIYFASYNISLDSFTSHTLRKTFGKRVYEMNNQYENSLILLSQIFNHSSIAITRRYIGITKENIKDVYLNM